MAEAPKSVLNCSCEGVKLSHLETTGPHDTDERITVVNSFWQEQAPFNDEEENVSKFLLVEIQFQHSLYCPLSLHCCTYLVIQMTQLLSCRNCQISCKGRCVLISFSYGKGCIVSSWEKGIKFRISLAFWSRYLMSWQSSVAQLKRRTELSTCWQVCQSPTVSLSLPWRQAPKAQWRQAPKTQWRQSLNTYTRSESRKRRTVKKSAPRLYMPHAQRNGW